MTISRRQFILVTAADLMLQPGYDDVLPHWENKGQSSAKAPKSTEIELQRLRIRSHNWQEAPPTADRDYLAEVLIDGGQFLYRAKGVTVPITEYEASKVIKNPYLYYFSTALKLHYRINRQMKLEGPR